MITNISVFVSNSTNVHKNLAIEEYLAKSVSSEECILYLWQNSSTVVIGRNQNAWRECRTEVLSKEGGLLARRLSGGGAVYQDLGNLNFTFCTKIKNSDVKRQQSVIVEACKCFGINAEISGRNDLLADGKKFSGNSFCTKDDWTFHNGTLLISADKNLMDKYLSPSKLKFMGKGVESVRSRTINLATLCPTITIEDLSNALIRAFESVYNLKAEIKTKLDNEEINRLYDKFSSYDWNFGRTIPFKSSIEDRFSWGIITLEFNVTDGICENVNVWTDSLDTDFVEPLKKGLIGSQFSKKALKEAVNKVEECRGISNDLCQMIDNADL